MRLAFRDALSAQPKHIHQQEEEDDEGVFFGDAIEADRQRIE